MDGFRLNLVDLLTVFLFSFFNFFFFFFLNGSRLRWTASG
jgi:hypothetical protein